MKKSKKKYSSKLPPHYTSIDYLNMLAWDKIHETGNFEFLLIKPKKLNQKQKEKLSKIWISIYNEFIRVFGFGDTFKAIMEKKLIIAKLQLKKIITQDESIQNFIRAEEIKLESIQKRLTGSGNIYKSKQAIEKNFGIRILLKETSVKEFYSYLDDLKKKK